MGGKERKKERKKPPNSVVHVLPRPSPASAHLLPQTSQLFLELLLAPPEPIHLLVKGHLLHLSARLELVKGRGESRVVAGRLRLTLGVLALQLALPLLQPSYLMLHSVCPFVGRLELSRQRRPKRAALLRPRPDARSFLLAEVQLPLQALNLALEVGLDRLW